MASSSRLLFFFALFLFVPTPSVSGFSFSDYEAKEESAAVPPTPQLTELQCPKSLTTSKIATMIGEMHRERRYVYWGYHGGLFSTDKAVYGSLIDKLNRGFEQLGLRTFTAAEINEQIAQEEQEAFLNNDLDAAMTAADRLQADFMLKGIVSTHTQLNTMVKIDEVFVTIDLTLYASDGRQLSTARVKETTFSDADITATIQDIVSKQANRITYDLFADYCKGGK